MSMIRRYKRKEDYTEAELKQMENFGVYWYTFPSMQKKSEDYPIKIGVSTSGKYPSVRVMQQCTAMPEKPIILGIHLHAEAKILESFIHKKLTKRGKHKHDAGGSEWFITSHKEIMNLISQFNYKHPNIAHTDSIASEFEEVKQELLIKESIDDRRTKVKDPYYDSWSQTQKHLYVKKGVVPSSGLKQED